MGRAAEEGLLGLCTCLGVYVGRPPYIHTHPNTPNHVPKPTQTPQKQGEQLRIESFELGVLFLPSKYQRFARAFSLTPDHPLLGLRSAAHTRVVDGVRGFYSASCEDMRCVVLFCFLRGGGSWMVGSNRPTDQAFF